MKGQISRFQIRMWVAVPNYAVSATQLPNSWLSIPPVPMKWTNLADIELAYLPVFSNLS